MSASGQQPHVRLSWLTARAKLAYATFAENTGNEVPFERLSNREHDAWIAVVEFLAKDPDCECGQPLLCGDCDRESAFDAFVGELTEQGRVRMAARLRKWIDDAS